MSETQTHLHTALLVMDMQVSIASRYAQTDDFFGTTKAAIETARAASIPVIYVVVGFRPGYPEMSPRNKIFSSFRQRSSSQPAPLSSMEVHPAIAPQP
ncbi:MAG TPA: isochorismatase family protein, partial [Ktedonobacteraceae bacterium]|nr:isochorismatase family protein [Ktedonobacteraceae bacterium]